MKVRCIDDSDSVLALGAGKVYEVVAEHDQHYRLMGVRDLWRKARFEIVPDEKSVENIQKPVEGKKMDKIAVATKWETHTVNEYHVVFTQKEMEGLFWLLSYGTGFSTVKALGLSEFQRAMADLAGMPEKPDYAGDKFAETAVLSECLNPEDET